MNRRQKIKLLHKLAKIEKAQGRPNYSPPCVNLCKWYLNNYKLLFKKTSKNQKLAYLKRARHWEVNNAKKR